MGVPTNTNTLHSFFKKKKTIMGLMKNLMIETGNCFNAKVLNDFEGALCSRATIRIEDIDKWIEHPKFKCDLETFQYLSKNNVANLTIELYDERRSKGLSTEEMLRSLKNPKLFKNGRMPKRILIEGCCRMMLVKFVVKYYQEHIMQWLD